MLVELLAAVSVPAFVWWLRWGRVRPVDSVPPHLATCGTCRCPDQVGADR